MKRCATSQSRGRAKETVYAIFILDDSGALMHVVSLRELIQADRTMVVALVGDQREPLSVGPLVDREDAARLISKYNLLAIPSSMKGSMSWESSLSTMSSTPCSKN